jgi:octaprenyl-diphosphate synthase
VEAECGLEAAAGVMDEYVGRARKLLSGFPQSPYRDSLDQLCLYIAERDK